MHGGLVALVAKTALACQAPHPLETHAARAIAPLTAPELSLRPAAAIAAPIPSAPRREPTRAAVDSRSRGTTGRGYLERGARLPADHEAIRATTGAVRSGGLFGHADLVAALTRAATRIRAEHPDSVLFVGDLSKESGSTFPPHASHTNGRDVDLAFFVTDRTGSPRDAGAMTRVLPSGTVVASGLQFDPERNWLLIEYLLRDPAIQIQWIFVAAEVETILIDAARRLGRDPTTIERAARVMLQPRDSSPHNDHFHVRIYCNRTDRLEGCIDAAPFHPWIDDHGDALETWLSGIAPFFALPGTEEYRWALDEVARNFVREALPLLEGLPVPDDASDALLRAAVIDHLRQRHHGTNPWKDAEPLETPP